MTAAMRALLLVMLIVALLASPAGAADDFTLSVAISMKEAVEELGRTFGASRRDVVLRYNFGASGELAKQIEAGAPVDVFISAAARQMDELEAKRLIDPDTRHVFARNVIVIVKPADSSVDLARPTDLLDSRVRRVVVGNPKTVPVGQYAEESLRTLGLWDRLSAKLVLAENVRQALDYVARGEVDAGIVYATDVPQRAGAVKEVLRLPEDTYRPVTYPVAVVRDTRQPALARAFVELLTGAQGQQVLRRLGFRPPPAGAR